MAKPETGQSITAGSPLGRALLALRPGGMTTTEATERWPTYGTSYFNELRRLGLVAYDGETWTITAAGRAACPYRNQILAEKPEIKPEVFTMPRGETKMTRQQVLAAIQAAGAAGTTRKALIEKFGCSESNIDNHIMFLNRSLPAVITKPRPGVLVAVEFASQVTHGSALPAVDIHGISLDVDHHEVGELPAASHAAQMALIAEPARYAVAFPGDFHGSIDAAIAQATRDYESDSLKQAIIVACTPLGRIEVRPVFVPQGDLLRGVPEAA